MGSPRVSRPKGIGLYRLSILAGFNISKLHLQVYHIIISIRAWESDFGQTVGCPGKKSPYNLYTLPMIGLAARSPMGGRSGNIQSCPLDCLVGGLKPPAIREDLTVLSEASKNSENSGLSIQYGKSSVAVHNTSYYCVYFFRVLVMLVDRVCYLNNMPQPVFAVIPVVWDRE